MDTQEVEKLWTVADFAKTTQIAKSTIYEWCHLRYVPHLKVRGCLRFRPSEVAAWLEQHANPGRASRVPAVEV